MPLDAAAVDDLVATTWADEIVPALTEYIRIPNVSPEYEPDWAERGHMDRAAALVADWMAASDIPGLSVEVVRLAGRTPLVYAEVPASGAAPGAPADTVLLYGHLDKQPPMEGWREGLGPWDPVLEGDRLYGRGGGDDGYAAFASLTAIAAVRAAGGAHARCVLLIEASEESGSPDLPAYVDHLADRIGTPSLVVCLDSWAPDESRLWLTTSLRGLVQARLRVEVLTEGVHSGQAGGVVPSSFRILRQLLDRVEDAATGTIRLGELQGPIPFERRRQAIDAVAAGVDVAGEMPWAGRPPSADPVEQLLSVTWAPSLSVTGVGGAPEPQVAGNVQRPYTEVALSLRLHPGTDPTRAREVLEAALTTDAPPEAVVTLDVLANEAGWAAPETAAWLATAVDDASIGAFGDRAGAVGVGGTIPFMAMLGHRYPDAQFVITGVLVPGSNAHGPNEFLHLPTGRRVTAAVAHILDAHAHR